MAEAVEETTCCSGREKNGGREGGLKDFKFTTMYIKKDISYCDLTNNEADFFVLLVPHASRDYHQGVWIGLKKKLT